jgi:hypothetical protein
VLSIDRRFGHKGRQNAMASQITPVTRGFSMWMPPFWAATSGAQGCCESRHDDRHRTPRQNGGAAPALSRSDLRLRATLPAFGARGLLGSACVSGPHDEAQRVARVDGWGVGVVLLVAACHPTVEPFDPSQGRGSDAGRA